MNIPTVNHTVNYFVHAYKQAPWRIQRQWVGAFLLAMLGLAMVAALYLDVTSQAAISGRGIQDLTNEMIAVQNNSADLQTKLAELTSTNSMEQRALSLGYEPITSDQIEYVYVPGYITPKPAILAGAPALRPSAPSIPPEYTESLIEWLDRRLGSPSVISLTGVSQ